MIAALTLSFPPSAMAQGQERVIVPDVPGGTASVRGCYDADRTIYGPYRVSFCLQRPGSYKVRGGGVRCDGTLSWKTSGKYVKADFRRQSCNRGVAWEAGSMTCRPRSALDILIEALNQKNSGSGRVIVNDEPRVKVLKCTYFPRVAGEKPTAFFARLQ